MIGRLVHKADFERLLASRAQARSAHFALHHVPRRLLIGPAATAQPEAADLSTELAQKRSQPVYNCDSPTALGCVVPKRHARRAVTRSLLKRQIRSAFGRHAGTLPAGHWLVRLRAGFAVAQFVSAASPALARVARRELDELLARSAR